MGAALLFASLLAAIALAVRADRRRAALEHAVARRMLWEQRKALATPHTAVEPLPFDVRNAELGAWHRGELVHGQPNAAIGEAWAQYVASQRACDAQASARQLVLARSRPRCAVHQRVLLLNARCSECEPLRAAAIDSLD